MFAAQAALMPRRPTATVPLMPHSLANEKLSTFLNHSARNGMFRAKTIPQQVEKWSRKLRKYHSHSTPWAPMGAPVLLFPSQKKKKSKDLGMRSYTVYSSAAQVITLTRGAY